MSLKLNVLIVEDDTIIGMDIVRIVEQSGCDVLSVVADYQDALQAIADNTINLLISDIRLGGKEDGIEIASKLQKRYGIPVIFLTAFQDDNTLERASDVDFIGYLVKPFREDELKVLIKLCIKKNSFQASGLTPICNGYQYRAECHTVYYEDQRISLTGNEKILLFMLINAKGNIVPYTLLDDEIWQGNFVSDTSRRQLLHRLKSKMPDLCLEVVKGQGYKLNISP
ncbi:MAG: response regulator [Epsilonproteobacteria bacterium]|nr:response regulator [Campylobacterota bacterium]